MIRPDTAKWQQTPDDLLRLATDSAHPRTRERFLALFQIATQQTNATQWAERIGRCDECVMSWVHAYNARGPEAMIYRRTGGAAPLLRRPRHSRSLKRSPRNPRRTTCPEAVGR
jgi:transposase